MARRTRRHPDREAVGAPKRRGRLAALTLGAGVAIVVVFALVFSIAYGSRGVAAHAAALHNADEALRAATVARSQSGLAAHLSILERDFEFDAGDGIDLSESETRLALDDLESALQGMSDATGNVDAGIQSSAATFSVTVGDVLDRLDAGDVDGAEAIAVESLDRSFRALIGYVVVERDHQAGEVAAANALMGRIGDIARFLVAFLVPTAAIVIYRELSRRQQRQRDLEVRLDTEKELNKARDEFVANASHELRTPLTSIFGLAHLLEEDSAVQGSESSLEMTGMIISETNDLSRMVDDLLTTARLDAGALHYQFENINALDEVREVVLPMRRSGAAIGVDCQPALVRSDRLRLRQVVRNLISNANKYGGASVRIIGRIVAGWYEVRVEDDGEGIPEELHDRLFQRFLHQGDLPLVLGSVGLGLSIVRALTEGMGGAVWYERRQGWTCFVVRVPLATTDERSGYRESGHHGAMSERRTDATAVARETLRALGGRN
ncbi:MAG TPA: HAMP domain-containing sensor histidine kinase [Acidimicrobiia bacterium]|nr:HAMP domain-containing sensor histidine kinase [Acidimicrobiia bacterium]